jgi:hypothetical protein
MPTSREAYPIHQNLQTFVVRQLFVKLAIGFSSLGEASKFLGPFCHRPSIDLEMGYSERI